MAVRNEAKIKFIAETTEFNEQIRKANQTFTELRSEMKLVQAQFKGNEQSVEALTEKKRVLQQQLSASADKVEALKQKLQKAKDIYGENSTEVSKLKTQLNNAQRQYVETENAIEGVNAELNDQEKETEETTTAMKGLDSAMERAGEGFTVFKGVISNLVTDGIRLLIDGLKEAARYAVITGMDFEAGMSQVKAISGATADEMELLTAEAMRVGESTKFSASEAAEGLNYMAMAGWKSEDMLAGLEGMANLAAAANADLGTASDIVTDTLTAMGYAAGDSAKLADVMASAASNANTNVEMMGYTFKYAAPVAGSLGYNMEDLAVATGLMANAGIKGEQAGTTLRAGLTNLVKPAKSASDAMEKYGINIKNADGTVKPLSETMEMLRKKLGDLPEAEQAAAAAAIFGKEAMSGWLAVINTSDEDLEKLSTAIYNSEGAAKKMASTMQDNLKGDVEELGGAVDTLAINIQSKFNGAMRDGVQAIRDFVTGSAFVSETFARLSGAAGQAIDVIKGYLPQLGQMGKELVTQLAQGLVTGLPTLATGAANIIVSIGNGLAANSQKILEMGGQLVMGLGQSIVAAVPKLITSAANIVKSLASGIAGNAETFISKGLDLLNGFADSLTRSVPTLVKNGMEFIRNLVKGLMNSLPELISRVPEIISKFANIINDNAPTIIAAGIGIIKDLIVGLIKAIPTLIANIPQIAKAIFDGFMAFNWLQLGKNVVTLVKNGMTSMVGAVKSAGQAVANGFKSAFSTFGTWTKNTFTAAWNGAKGVWTKAQPFFKNVATGVRGAFNGVDAYLSKTVFANAWAGIKNVWGVAAGYFKNIWLSIKTTFSVVKNVLTGNFSDAWKGIKSILSTWKSYFAGIWNGIKSVFSNTKTWFSTTFSNAWKAIKNVFSGWGSFWGGLWDKIKNKFSSIGTSIAGAISSSVKSGLNGVLSAIESVINKGINLINGAIGIINKIPGVNIGSIGRLSLPRLAKGGVLYGETAFIGGEYAGARRNPEIVTPQKIMRETFEDALATRLENNFNLDRLAAAIEELASRPINIMVNDKVLATATAGATDSVSGNRLNLRNRGLAL